MPVAVAALVIWISLRGEGDREPARRVQALRTLESLRAEFKRADGSLPDDTELVRILQAKGIPFADKPIARQQSPSAQLPAIQFATTKLGAAEREQIHESVQAVLPAQLEDMRQLSADIALLRIEVDTSLRLQLHFNSAFRKVADDESRLTDFSESLNSLGNTALRGSAIYIDGQPLGIYLRDRDAARNREAKDSSPSTPADARR